SSSRRRSSSHASWYRNCSTSERVSTDVAAAISSVGGHVLDPGGELVTDVDLAGAGPAAEGAAPVGHVLPVAAPDIDPVGTARAEPRLSALVHFEVIGEDGRAGAVDDVRERDRVPEHALRRALEPEGVRVDGGPVHGDRVDDPKLAELAHEGAVGIHDAVEAPLAQHARGALASQAPLERGPILGERRMIEGRHHAAVVVIVAHPGVTVAGNPEPGVLPDVPRRPVLEHRAADALR